MNLAFTSLTLQAEITDEIVNVTGLSKEKVAGLMTTPKDPAHGDLAFPCFEIAKHKSINPAEAAKFLCENIKCPIGISKASAIGPYANFTFDRKVVGALILEEITRANGDICRGVIKEPAPLILEYSSPNIAKTLHIGHLRNTLLGSSLEKILKYLGFNVVTVNHLGDWGTQFGIVYVGAEIFGKPVNPSVDALVDLYIKAAKIKKEQEEGKVSEENKSRPDVTKESRDYFLRLENKDQNARDFWKWCLDVSLNYFIEQYDRLGIRFDNYTGESFYEDMVPATETLLKDAGILENSEGALGVDLGKPDGFVRVFAEDGRSLYITRDIAAALYRYNNFKPHKILYVVGNQQALHFRQLKGLFKKMAHPVADLIVHVQYGFVPGMKTREGTGISLKGFLDEAQDKAQEAYNNEVKKKPDGVDEAQIARDISIGATYFYFLNQSAIKDLQFRWEEALSFTGDSGPYLQYAVARINGIESKAKEAGIFPKLSAPEELANEYCWEIVRAMLKFPSALHRAAESYEPVALTTFALELAKAFARSYKNLRVLGEEKSKAETNLYLFCACRALLSTALRLIGVPVVDRM